MTKYRVKKEVNEITREERFVVQFRFFFCWYTCRMGAGWEAIYDNFSEAQSAMYNKIERESWK